MTEEETISTEEAVEAAEERFWMNLARRYWYFVVIFGIIMVGAIIGFILTLNWYIANQGIGGFGTWTFNDFSLGEAVWWCIYFVLWSILFVGLPTLLAAGLVAAIAWFAVLPSDVKAEIKARPKGGREAKQGGGSGGFSFILFLGVCLKIWLDGNWLTKFSSLPFGYFVHTWIFVLIWVLIIFGIPAAIIGLIWFLTKYKKTT